MRCNRKLNLVWIDAEDLEDATRKTNPLKYETAWSQLTATSGCEYYLFVSRLVLKSAEDMVCLLLFPILWTIFFLDLIRCS
jgi:hypothetical protein